MSIPPHSGRADAPKDPFSMTPEGCRQAQEWLANQLHRDRSTIPAPDPGS